MARCNCMEFYVKSKAELLIDDRFDSLGIDTYIYKANLYSFKLKLLFVFHNKFRNSYHSPPPPLLAKIMKIEYLYRRRL